MSPVARAATSGLELEKPISAANGDAPLPSTEDAPVANGKKGDVPDAGLRSLDHYKNALPKWRYSLRQKILPLVRLETPYLAYMQGMIRTPALDSYFAITANLGTHTFFMISLPIMFWCGFPWFGKGLIHILAGGVFFTGFIKDMLSLPRPLSPPLHRISMSGSAALEYGFPSTHSANAVSVAVYAIFLLRSDTNPLPEQTKFALECLAYFYAASIIFGRLYCGMHGFLDVIFGSLIGISLGVIEFFYGPGFDGYLTASTWTVPLVLCLAIILLVRVHPEPADDCPCFDDSVAFAGVVIGLEFGTWRFSRSPFSYSLLPSLAESPFAVAETLGWPKMVMRVVSGVLVIFAWRETMKPTMLKLLPHVFRFIETRGFSLPRRFFTPASEYKNIPLRLRVDNVIPNVSDLPDFISSFRAPGRGRSVSVGPQSAADAYETLAYRERRRRESVGSQASLRSKGSLYDLKEKSGEDDESQQRAGRWRNGGATGAAGMLGRDGLAAVETPDGENHPQSPLEMYEQMMGQGRVMMTGDGTGCEEPEIYVARENELGEREVFSKLIRPRVRYDVEVVTKLVVYTGIAWLSVDIIPVLFEFIGLGVGLYK